MNIPSLVVLMSSALCSIFTASIFRATFASMLSRWPERAAAMHWFVGVLNLLFKIPITSESIIAFLTIDIIPFFLQTT